MTMPGSAAIVAVCSHVPAVREGVSRGHHLAVANASEAISRVRLPCPLDANEWQQGQ